MASKILSKEDQEFLAQCEEEFKDRFTENDEDFMKVYNSEPSKPPILENWWIPNNSGRRHDRRYNRRHHTYDRYGNRDRGFQDRRYNSDSRGYNDRRDNYDSRGYNDRRDNHDSRGYNDRRDNHDSRGYNDRRDNHDSRGYNDYQGFDDGQKRRY